MSDFKREPRYIVVKRSDLRSALRRVPPETKVEFDIMLEECRQVRRDRGVGPLDCVVVESDWGIYETVWKLVELEHDRKALSVSAEGGWIPFAAGHEMPPRGAHVWCKNRNGIEFEGCICYGMHAPFFTFPAGWKDASDTAPDWIDVTHWRPMGTKS